MMSKKSVVFLSASVFFLVLMISAVRLVDFASAGQPAHISRIDRFQQCENRAGAGFFWVDTTNGETWWADPGNVRWAYGGKPEGVETAVIGTYMPCPNNAGGGLFIVNTATGEAWWTMGYKPEWKALGKPETADAGKIGTYMPCENMGGAGLYVLNTTTGSGWWTPPTDKQGWEVLDNPEAKAGEIGTYIPYRNKSSAGLFILNTATGECWWTNGKDWKRLDKGGAVGGEIGTYMPYDNKDGAGILILSTKTGEGWWTNGGDWEFFGRPSGTSLAGADKPQAKSVLLQNDPNPFNSETWIPYQLKDAASVSIRIYDFTGQLVRALDLGRKDAGVYISRSEAAYWDGEDEDGKEAASGVYFYRISLKREGRKDIVEIGKMAKLTGTPPPGVDKLQQLILKISDPGPDMTYGTMVLNDQVVSVETLLDSLQRAAPKQKQMLIIQSGRNVPHDQMVKVMDLAKRAGIEKIGFSMVAK